VLQAGGGQYFDIMNFHTYPSFSSNWTSYGPGLLQKTNAIRAKMAEYNVNKPIIITEAGWHSNNPPSYPGSPEIQSRYVAQLFTQSMAANIEIMIWWMLYDPGSYYWENGLITDAGIRKPSFTAFQTIVSQLGTAHFERTLSVSETGASDMEVYEFEDYVHNKTIYVAWLNPIETNSVKPLRLATPSLLVSDIYGNSYIVHDGDDGAIDGHVTISVGGQPLYLVINK
jgi:hypothetical protein